MNKATEKEIRDLLIQYNPNLFGPDANPIVPTKTRFILTGEYRNGEGGEKIKLFVLPSKKLSDEARKANPGLPEQSNYIRLSKTDFIKPVVSLDDVVEAPRKAWSDNLFENQNPELFGMFVQWLTESKICRQGDEAKAKFQKENGRPPIDRFVDVPDTAQGNPKRNFLNPVEGAFVVVQVPGHKVIGADGKVMVNARRDIATNSYGKSAPVIMREMRLFLLKNQIPSLMSIAIAQYIRRVEPMLAEEVVYKVNTKGDVTEKKVIDYIDAEQETPEEGGTDDSGNALGL